MQWVRFATSPITKQNLEVKLTMYKECIYCFSQEYVQTVFRGLRVRSPALSKTAALLQIAAMLLIQLYAVAPLFSHHFIAYAHVMRCTGDHARCGCSPERIVSGTCCCCQSKRLGFFKPVSGCCNKTPNRDKKFEKDGHNRLIPSIGAIPCCDDPASISVSLEKLKFLRPAIHLFTPAALSVEYHLLSRTAYQGRIPEPPDPPPRLFILS